MLNKILSVTKEELNSIDLGAYKDMSKNGSPKNWFFMEAGREHYRLLAYISGLFNGETLLDIGTYQGSSSIALSFNDKNKVASFDVVAQPEIKKISVANIEYYIGNVLDHPDLILFSPFILLDTYHDGVFEKEFMDKLIEIDYHGIVMFDDIYLNDEMKKFWEGITQEKHDLTPVGHFTGTGIVKL